MIEVKVILVDKYGSDSNQFIRCYSVPRMGEFITLRQGDTVSRFTVDAVFHNITANEVRNPVLVARYEDEKQI